MSNTTGTYPRQPIDDAEANRLLTFVAGVCFLVGALLLVSIDEEAYANGLAPRTALMQQGITNDNSAPQAQVDRAGAVRPASERIEAPLIDSSVSSTAAPEPVISEAAPATITRPPIEFRLIGLPIAARVGYRTLATDSELPSGRSPRYTLARISADGTTRLPYGRIELRIEARGYRPRTLELLVLRGSDREVDARLERTHVGALTVNTTPEAASVSIRNRHQVYRAGVALAPGTVALSVSAPDFVTRRVEIDVEGPTRIHVALDHVDQMRNAHIRGALLDALTRLEPPAALDASMIGTNRASEAFDSDATAFARDVIDAIASSGRMSEDLVRSVLETADAEIQQILRRALEAAFAASGAFDVATLDAATIAEISRLQHPFDGAPTRNL